MEEKTRGGVEASRGVKALAGALSLSALDFFAEP